MSYLVLARKYRPQNFESVVGQGHVVHTLQQAIAAGRVAHAILFAGPRGTGKTTVARILAKAMNCQAGPTPQPCNQCRACREITAGHAVDVFEIDGASNNSVDQVRELRENVKYLPAGSAYKIYIIDEVHMLSLAAFNALLKTLEEPPAHVLFLFATTEPHKIPVTILSRCRRYDFRRVAASDLSAHIAHICRQEGVSIESACLETITRQAGGSVRDALSLLDQLMSAGQAQITQAAALALLGAVDRKFLYEISAAGLAGDVGAVLETLDTVYNGGQDMKKFYTELLEHFRNLLVVKLDAQPLQLVNLPAREIDAMRGHVQSISAGTLNRMLDSLLREESAVRFSAQPKLILETVFLRQAQFPQPLSIDTLIAKLDALQSAAASGGEIPRTRVPAAAVQPEAPISEDSAETPPGEPASGTVETPPAAPDEAPRPAASRSAGEIWNDIVDALQNSHPALSAQLSQCTLRRLDGEHLCIEVCGSPYVRNTVQKKKNLEILQQVCKEYFGCAQQIDFTAAPDASPSSSLKSEPREQELKQEALNHPLVTEVLEIFDGRVVEVKILKEVPE